MRRTLCIVSSLAVGVGNGAVGQEAPAPKDGLAALYPGDVGIERDPRVIFAEDFEENSLEALWKRWETVGAKESMSFGADVPSGSAGKQSLLMDRKEGPALPAAQRQDRRLGI
ncbi:MAG: hypothetical protein HY721_27295 [Planctomycetes bacterium]|nr:hypothetical protein [Planctomycetota bacterium]